MPWEATTSREAGRWRGSDGPWRKTMGKPWENGKTIGKPWENGGLPSGKHTKNDGKSACY